MRPENFCTQPDRFSRSIRPALEVRSDMARHVTTVSFKIWNYEFYISNPGSYRILNQ